MLAFLLSLGAKPAATRQPNCTSDENVQPNSCGHWCTPGHVVSHCDTWCDFCDWCNYCQYYRDIANITIPFLPALDDAIATTHPAFGTSHSHSHNHSVRGGSVGGAQGSTTQTNSGVEISLGAEETRAAASGHSVAVAGPLVGLSEWPSRWLSQWLLLAVSVVVGVLVLVLGSGACSWRPVNSVVDGSSDDVHI